MIPAVALLFFGYALTYTGLGGLSGGALTGGNKQGLLASLGFTAAKSSVTSFNVGSSLDAKAASLAQPASGSTGGATVALNGGAATGPPSSGGSITT